MTGNPQTGTMLTAALGYAARGWHVFTLTSTKVPFANCDRCQAEHTTQQQKETCTCLLCRGFYAATTNPDRIKAMLDQSTRVCLAIRTGAISGLAVVDVDIRNWTTDGPAPHDPAWRTLTRLDKQRLLPGTLTANTASGGLHLYYAHPGGYLLSGANKYGPGVDSKADGAYVIAPPSVNRTGTPYQWAGDGRYDHPLTPMREQLAATARPPTPTPRPPRAPTGPVGTRTRLRGLVHTVLDAPEGQRNDLLHWAAKKAGEMIAAGEIDQDTVVNVLQDAATTVGLTTNEIGDQHRGTIASGLSKGLHAGKVNE